MAKKLATFNLPFQAFKGFIETENKNNFSILARAFLENFLFVGFMQEKVQKGDFRKKALLSGT